MFEPVSRVTAVDAVILQIRNLIARGDLKPGDRLPSERDLSERLRVGRPTVREALRVLSSLGVVQRGREGTYVNSGLGGALEEPLKWSLMLKKTSIFDLVEARKMLEVTAAGLAATRASEDDVREMSEALAAMEENKDNLDAYTQANIRFHTCLAEAAQNEVLLEMFKSITALLESSHKEVLRAAGALERSIEFHRLIFDAVVRQDAERARHLMQEHIEYSESVLKALFAEGADARNGGAVTAVSAKD